MKAAQEMIDRLSLSSRDRELVLTSVSSRKVRDHLHFHFDKIAKKYGFVSDNHAADYQRFERNSHKLQRLVRVPSGQEESDSAIDYVYSDFYKKPVIISGHFDRESLVTEARNGVHEVLTHLAVADDSDEVRECFQLYRCDRGGTSPYFYPDYQIYELIKSIGTEKVQQILDRDSRSISEQMKGIEILQAMGYDIRRMEADYLKKQIFESCKLNRSNIWGYLENREKIKIDQRRSEFDENDQERHWLSLVGRRQARELYGEGKRMYWLAQQVWRANPFLNEDERFYQADSYVDWTRYDLSEVDVSEEKVKEYLEEHRNIMIALLGHWNDDYPDSEPKGGTQATLGLLIKALECGQNLRGVALANDKQRYLEGLIKGEIEDDLEFAVADWPTEWKEAISEEEINLYYEYASDYVLIDPNGLARYAEWRSSDEGKDWSAIFEEVPKRKSDLDFEFVFVHKRKKSGAGTEKAQNMWQCIMQDYFLRFNSIRGGDGRFADMHDAFFWISNIRKLESSEAKSVITSIETMDEYREFINLLPRYSADRDPLADQGPIQSVRELRKRVIAIESNIDIRNFRHR
jgi:hypothetical protein